MIAWLRVYYRRNTSDTSLRYINKNVHVNDIVDGLGDGVSKADVLKMIFASVWNEIMEDLKSDTSLSEVYLKDSRGNPLYQTLESTEHGVTLKGDSKVGAYFYLEMKLAQMLEIAKATGAGFGRGVHVVLSENENLKTTRTYRTLNSKIYLQSDVDWVFDTLHSTPWPQSYIPKTVYKHVDIYCDVGQAQKVNNTDNQIMLHAEVPGGGVITPTVRSYVNLSKVDYNKIKVWINDTGGNSLATLPNAKTRITLHFRKKLQTS